jgi:hypothetical protein
MEPIRTTGSSPYSAASCRLKANECDLRAASTESDTLKAQLQDIAGQWRHLADQADRQSAADDARRYHATFQGAGMS